MSIICKWEMVVFKRIAHVAANAGNYIQIYVGRVEGGRPFKFIRRRYSNQQFICFAIQESGIIFIALA